MPQLRLAVAAYMPHVHRQLERQRVPVVLRRRLTVVEQLPPRIYYLAVRDALVVVSHLAAHLPRCALNPAHAYIPAVVGKQLITQQIQLPLMRSRREQHTRYILCVQVSLHVQGLRHAPYVLLVRHTRYAAEYHMQTLSACSPLDHIDLQLIRTLRNLLRHAHSILHMVYIHRHRGTRLCCTLQRPVAVRVTAVAELRKRTLRRLAPLARHVQVRNVTAAVADLNILLPSHRNSHLVTVPVCNTIATHLTL